jgi:hypothetical protein
MQVNNKPRAARKTRIFKHLAESHKSPKAKINSLVAALAFLRRARMHASAPEAA